jgi:hypothetical protein
MSEKRRFNFADFVKNQKDAANKKHKPKEVGYFVFDGIGFIEYLDKGKIYARINGCDLYIEVSKGGEVKIHIYNENTGENYII